MKLLNLIVETSDHVKYHVNNGFSLTENVFRYSSDSFVNLWGEAKSAIILGLNYGPKNSPLEKIHKKKSSSTRNISVSFYLIFIFRIVLEKICPVVANSLLKSH